MSAIFKTYGFGELDRMFNKLWDTPTVPFINRIEVPTNFTSTTYSEFKSENGDSGWKLSIPMPGIEKENVSIFIEDNTVEVAFSESKKSDTKTDRTYKISFTVPNDIQEDTVDASLNLGILQIKLLNKTERKSVSKIHIK